MRTTSRRVISALAVVAVSACSLRASTSVLAPEAPATTSPEVGTQPQVVSPRAVEAPEDLAFWSEFAIDAHWVEVYPTVREMTAAADLAAIANVRSVVPLEPIRGDAPGSGLAVVGLVMEVVTDFTGSGMSEFTLRLESPVEGEEYTNWVEALASRLPSGSAYFALRETEGGLYRIMNSWSVWIASGSGLTAPLDSHFEDNRELFEGELRGLTTYDQLSQYLFKSV